MEILDEIAEGFVDKDDKEEGGKSMDQLSEPCRCFLIARHPDGKKETYPEGVAKDQRMPVRDLPSKKEGQQDEARQKKKGEAVKRR